MKVIPREVGLMVRLGCGTVSNLTYLSIVQPEGWQP